MRTRSSRRLPASAARGFTLAEILLVLTLTSVGFIAVINLQIGTVQAVAAGRNLTEATNLAEHVIELIRSEAVEWTADGETVEPTRFPYLSVAGAPAASGGSDWTPAMLSPIQGVDERLGSLGSDVNPRGEAMGQNLGILNEFPLDRNRRFCVYYRLTWIIPDYLLRADVRVSWMRQRTDQTVYQDCSALEPERMFNDLSRVASITLPATVMRNVFAGLN
ncbi:MAG: hypothetical protein FJ098_08185 [Deltaproteobacteria bacterium]|nr:hypothetical protein [Deltaproteobacteria bacterium]